MKKFSLAKLLSLVVVCVMLVGALALTAFAAEDENVDIVAANVYYGDVYQIMYAVDAPDGATLKATDSKGNEINVVPFTEAPTANINGVECKVYILETGVAAQAIDEVITLTVEYGNKKSVKNYSILQYVYERSQMVDGAELEMLQALLAYAVKADAFFNGATENSFDKYQYVDASGVTVNGINPKGMYAPGSTPFANLDAIEYDAEKYELVFTVNGEAKTLDEVKALTVGDTAITVVAEIVEKDCEHNYTSAVTNPTCTEAGYTTYTCESCGDTYTDNEVEATGTHLDNDGDFLCDYDNCEEIVEPKVDSVLTIEQALKLGALVGSQYTEAKYYVSGTVKNVYNTTYGNMYITDGVDELCIFGTYSADGSTRYDAMADKPVKGDTVTIYGVIGTYNTTVQMKSGWMTEHTAHNCVAGAEATCTNASVCTICDAILDKALGHSYADGVCSVCGEAEPTETTYKADLETLNANSSYTARETESGWTAVNAAVMSGGTTDSNPVFKFIGEDANTKAITLNGKTSAVGKLTSPTLNTGISKLTFNYGNAFSEKNGVDITINIYQNGAVVATKQLDNDSVTAKTAYAFEWVLDTAIEGDFVIEIVNNSPTNSTSNKDRVSIFNIEWVPAN